jgi:hypothetical protein
MFENLVLQNNNMNMVHNFLYQHWPSSVNAQKIFSSQKLQLHTKLGSLKLDSTLKAKFYFEKVSKEYWIHALQTWGHVISLYGLNQC